MSAIRQRFLIVMIALGMLAPLSMLAIGFVARAQDSFDRRAMLQSIVDNVILPGQSDFITAAEGLSAAADQFVSASTIENLHALHEAWRATANNWAQIALFDMDLRLTSYHNQIYKPPANYQFINDILTGDEQLTEAYVDGIGSTSKGLDALEYLIFDPDRKPSEIVESFADERRRQFALALAQNIERKAREIQAYWSPDGRDYASRFLKADQEGGQLQGTINMLANKIFNSLQTDLEMWLGEPSGIALDGEPHPDLVESPFGQHSLGHIAQRLIGLRKLFNGGVDDYLNFLGAEHHDGSLSDAINDRFETALTSIDAIDQPLALAVSDRPNQVAALYEDIRQLQILLRADMKSRLSILITLSDRDGDQ